VTRGWLLQRAGSPIPVSGDGDARRRGTPVKMCYWKVSRLSGDADRFIGHQFSVALVYLFCAAIVSFLFCKSLVTLTDGRTMTDTDNTSSVLTWWQNNKKYTSD